MVNKWQDYETGPNAPEEIYAVVENPTGTKNKYEYDKEKESVVLDRVLHSAVHYPGDDHHGNRHPGASGWSRGIREDSRR